jgi:hypothetical protein
MVPAQAPRNLSSNVPRPASARSRRPFSNQVLSGSPRSRRSSEPRDPRQPQRRHQRYRDVLAGAGTVGQQLSGRGGAVRRRPAAADRVLPSADRREARGPRSGRVTSGAEPDYSSMAGQRRSEKTDFTAKGATVAERNARTKRSGYRGFFFSSPATACRSSIQSRSSI